MDEAIGVRSAVRRFVDSAGYESTDFEHHFPPRGWLVGVVADQINRVGVRYVHGHGFQIVDPSLIQSAKTA